MPASAKSPSKSTEALASELRISIGLLLRRMRQIPVEGELSLPESSALARLDRGGPATASELAKREQISPQSIGATLAALEARGMIDREPDPSDGRRVILSLSKRGAQALHDRRSAKTKALATGLEAEFSGAELERLAAAAPLLERLAQSI
jgi:DNA-binding MarR family transcriptional regulator